MKKLILAIVGVLVPVWSFAAKDTGVIYGTVQDSAGRYVAGAVVSMATSGPAAVDSMRLTDSRGRFTFDNLPSGDFQIQVTKPGFAPSPKEKIQLKSSDKASCVFTMQRLEEVVERSISPDIRRTQDIVWTLRSSRGTQSVLRFSDAASTPLFRSLLPEYSGYFQIYSKSDPGARQLSLNKGSRFSITMGGLPSDAQVTVSGQYNESPLEPKGASAQYEFQPVDGHETRMGLDVRQGIMLDDAFSAEELTEFQASYSDKFRLANSFLVEQGAEFGHSEGRASVNYVRPRGALSWIPDDATVITAAVSAQAPSQKDDTVRSREYFEQINLPPAFEHYLHTEVGISRFLDDSTKISVALFEDRANYRALFVTAPDGRHGLFIFDGKNTPSRGFRFFANREFNGFETGFGYTLASGGAIPAGAARSLDELRGQIVPRRFHIITARIKADFELTNTELTAVYRWISKYAAGLIDPYQQGVEYSDPTLSISIAQNLPTFGAIPAKVQAIFDARNLFEQPFGSSRNELALSPRFVRGGISIQF